MFAGNSIRVSLGTEGIAELRFDRQNESINKFDARAVDELKAAADAIHAASAAVRGVLVTSAKESFIVGADIFEFTALFAQPEARIALHIERQNAAFTAFEDLNVPIVTVINGLALGGGLEMALASDARVMSESAQIGLPEVSLGLFPGFGGTVRLPRLIGAAAAIEWISSGRPQSARSALSAGAVDSVVAPDGLRSTAAALLESLIASGEWQARRKRRNGPFVADAEAVARARNALAKTAAHQPAALAAVELMERASTLPRDEALKLESAAFAKVARTQAAASLVQLFINDQVIKKKSKEYARTARKVGRVAVVGAGIMGGGISYISAVRGTPAIMKDIAQGALDLGIAEARKLLSRQVESARMQPDAADKVLASIRPSLDYSGFESVVS